MRTVKPEQFGQDHWSTLAYIETCCVDNDGKVALERMRCNPKTHPGLAVGRYSLRTWKNSWSTRIQNGVVKGHDDHDCAEDMEKAGLLFNVGTGINPAFKLTDEGWRVVAALRQHKATGGRYADFRYPKSEASVFADKLTQLKRLAAQACTCDGGRTTGCPACSAERQLEGLGGTS